MQGNELLEQSDIARYTKYEPNQTACIIRWLEQNRILYHRVKGGAVSTTLTALNSSLVGMRPESQEVELS